MKRQLNLQFFNGGGETGAENETVETAESKEAETEEKSFDSLLSENKTYKSEFDKKVSKALDTAKAKWEKQATERIQNAKSEAEKLAKMSADEKAEHARLEKEKELADREAELNKRELKQGAKDLLIEKNLPVEFAELISYKDAESTNEQISALSDVFNKAVELRVNERLKGKTPLSGNSTSGGLEDEITKAFNSVL